MIVVIGAGNFGTAIAHSIARNGHEIVMLSRNPDRVATLNSGNTLPDYPSVVRPVTLSATLDTHIITKALRIIIALPTQQTRLFLEAHHQRFNDAPVLLLQKGIEKETGLLPSQIVSQYLNLEVSVLSGPNFSDEILMGVPTATTISSNKESTALEWATLFKSNSFRPYVQTDMIGAHIGGAVKNVIAVACGVVQGLQLGDNTTAAIITRGLAEMARLGNALGAKKETFLGLSGLGDLTLTCHSLKSRNLRFGMALAKGEYWDESAQGTVEGYHTAFSLEKLSKKHGIEMPISQCVLKLIRNEILPQDIVSTLMSRELKQEVF
ncbi:MAG: NAD(P)H-dependent glycerol-3-phosphate dehydrogenase [Alphaproteobacteria bacterium]|nr:NAD(P)H-dependent glycerol-3-phosphate dehydrogenase [Alphaproteobacteria bacterium]